MRLRLPKFIIVMPLLALLATGCNDGDDAVFGNENGIEKKPPGLAAKGNTFTAQQAGGDATVVDAQYKLSIFTRSEARLCDGNVDIKIGFKSGEIDFDLPEAIIRCLSIEIDLSKMLSFAKSSESEPEISSDGKVLRIDRFGGGTFDPPRPLLVGPIFQNIDRFKGFDESKNYSVSGTNDQGSSYSGSGNIDIEVHDIEAKFTSEANEDLEFDNIVHWSMKASDFGEDVPKAKLLLFDNLEFYFNARPIMVPKIVMEGQMSYFIQGSGAGGEGGGVEGIADDFLGPLRIVLEVTDYQD